MSRGVQMKVDRMEAIRIVGAAIRQRTQEFEKRKRELPAATERMRRVIVRSLQAKLKRAGKADLEELTQMAGRDTVDWQERREFPCVPTLNVCELKEFLLVLQSDVRKVVPIHSNHEVWSALNSKCEVQRG